MPSPPIHIAEGVTIGDGRPFALFAGPDVIESEAHVLKMAEALGTICRERNVPLVFKASFDKANRTSLQSFRGPGLEKGLATLRQVKERTGLPLTTDFHDAAQAAPVAEVVDLLQVPAFLSRQTDVLTAAAATGRAINIKKGQFLDPAAARHAADKVRASGNPNVLLTERGVSFGYGNLVVDYRSIARLRRAGEAVCFDATHSVQLPSSGDGVSGGEREFVADLARAAVAVGVDALFFEVHDNPDQALCDGPNQIALDDFPALLDRLLRLQSASA